MHGYPCIGGASLLHATRLTRNVVFRIFGKSAKLRNMLNFQQNHDTIDYKCRVWDFGKIVKIRNMPNFKENRDMLYHKHFVSDIWQKNAKNKTKH